MDHSEFGPIAFKQTLRQSIRDGATGLCLGLIVLAGAGALDLDDSQSVNLEQHDR